MGEGGGKEEIPEIYSVSVVTIAMVSEVCSK